MRTPARHQDAPAAAETAVVMLRDLTEAVRTVAERLFDLPPDDAPGKRT